MAAKYLRKKLILYPRFQYALIWVNVLTLLLFFIAMALTIWTIFDQFRDNMLAANIDAKNPMFDYLLMQKTHLLRTLFIVFLLVLSISTTFVVFLSHKMVGPIIRLKHYLQNYLEKGQTEKLFFRDGDYFHDLPPIINKIIDRLNKKDSHHY